MKSNIKGLERTIEAQRRIMAQLVDRLAKKEELIRALKGAIQELQDFSGIPITITPAQNAGLNKILMDVASAQAAADKTSLIWYTDHEGKLWAKEVPKDV